MTTIDRNDAPDGYEARAIPVCGDACEACDLYTVLTSTECFDVRCEPYQRDDGQSVIFVKRKPRLVATGGRRPTPPEWAKRYRLLFRVGLLSKASGPVDKLPRSQNVYWDQRGAHNDILFVEWLP